MPCEQTPLCADWPRGRTQCRWAGRPAGPSGEPRSRPRWCRFLRSPAPLSRGDASPGMLVDDRERDRTGASTNVEYGRLAHSIQVLERPLDDDLGLGPRNQRPCVRLQRQPPEAPVAEDVCERLAARPAGEQRLVALVSLWRELALQVHVEERPSAVVARPREQQLGLEASGVDTRPSQ